MHGWKSENRTLENIPGARNWLFMGDYVWMTIYS